MPNIIYHKYRVWCKSCNDFSIHDKVYNNETTHEKFKQCKFEENETYALICVCGCQYTTVKISEIDKEKLKIQRERYKEQRTSDLKESMQVMLGGGYNMLNDLFSPVKGAETKIIESDAGLKYEEQLEKEARIKRIEERKQELLRFKNVGRNDICLCGSGLKYKKCCLLKHNNIRIN